MSNITKLDTPATQLAEAAQLVLDTLTKGQHDAKEAGTKKLRALYGADADNAAVTLAIRAARVMAGGDKPRGGAGARINETVKLVTSQLAPTPAAPAKELSAKLLVSAARATLDAHKRAEEARRAQLKSDRQAARDKLNDRGAPVGERRAAFELMTQLDATVARDKDARAEEALTGAIQRARAAGISAEQLVSIISNVYPSHSFDVAPVVAPVEEAAA